MLTRHGGTPISFDGALVPARTTPYSPCRRAPSEPQTRAYVAQLEFWVSTRNADIVSLRDALAPLVRRITLDEQATVIVVS